MHEQCDIRLKVHLLSILGVGIEGVLGAGIEGVLGVGIEGYWVLE
jgi:hypothetical protein